MYKQNKLTNLLKIDYPIIQGGMAGVSDAELVSAVSNAGGLGVLGSGFLPRSWLEKEIEKTKKLTDKPFGVNLLIRNPNITELTKVVIEKKVPIVFTGGGNPLPLFPHLKKAGIKIIPVVGSARLAKKMEENEADAVAVEGLESGGHIGKITTMVLVPQAKQLLNKIPLIAAGGIHDAKTAVAAFILGADGVQLGTRFLASKECPIHENYKKAILDATDENVVVVARFTGHPMRMIENELTKKVRKLEEKNPFPEEVQTGKYSSSKIENGNIEFAPLLCGLCAGEISKVKSCKEIIEGIVAGHKKIMERNE